MNVLQNIKTLYFLLIFNSIAFSYANNRPFDVDPPRYCLEHFHFLEDDFFCDTCGCGSSGGSMGYGTALNKNFMGLRYIGQEYRSRNGIFNNSPWINENFNTVQAWGNFPVTKRAIVNIILPYQFHNRIFPDNTEQKINGLGDISVLAFYSLIKATPDSIISIKPEHYLQLGGGLKLPTGKYDKANNTGSVNPSFQLGNGSWDYILAMNYGFSYRNWGISTMFNYTIKTKNPKDYQFGNQFNYGINAFKTYYVSDLAFTPIIGLAGENYASNREFDMKVANTKGTIFLGKLSLETAYQNYSLGLVGMVPIDQNLNNGKVALKHRVSVYLNINL